MSYTKHNFATGDTIQASPFNDMDDQIAANETAIAANGTAIGGKLAKPSGNGTSGQLLRSNGDGTTSWTDAPSSVTVDATLAVQGRAADAKAAGDAIAASRAAIAPAYADLTFPVAAGQCCWHSGALYQASAAIAEAEQWTADHWEAASLGSVIAGLGSGAGGASGSVETAWQELTANSTSSTGLLAKYTSSSGNVSTGGEGGYQFKVFQLEQGKTYKVYGFGYDRTIYYMAVLAESDFIASEGSSAIGYGNVECGTDAYPAGFTYHTIQITPEQDCYIYVNYKYEQNEAKVWKQVTVSSGGSGSASGGGGAYGKRGVHIHSGVYDCFQEDGGTYIVRRFTRRGPNNLFQWSALLLGSVDENTGFESSSTIATFSTDIVGPVSLHNSTLFPSNTSGMWAGGNHAVSGTENPTAEQHSLKCLVNGEEKSEDGVYYGDVRFISENYIYFPQSVSGSTLTSATRAITERREYCLNGQMHVRVRLYFDQAATVDTYYGMQAVTVGFTDILCANNEYYAVLANVSSAVDTLTAEERKIMLSNPTSGLHFDLALSDMGLGSYAHNAGSGSKRVSLPKQTGDGKNQKVYYVLINNDSIAQGSYLTWEGTYSLYFA